MNTQVYLHRIRRIYDYYLTEYMKLWGAENHKAFEDVIKHDDTSVLMEIRRDAQSENDRSKWARRIVERNHHRRVLETGDYADEQRLRRMTRVHRELKQKYPDIDFYIDDAKHDIHKLTVPGEQDPQKVEDLYIAEKDGKLKVLAEDSAIIRRIPKRARTVQIFADAKDKLLEKFVVKHAHWRRKWHERNEPAAIFRRSLLCFYDGYRRILHRARRCEPLSRKNGDAEARLFCESAWHAHSLLV